MKQIIITLLLTLSIFSIGATTQTKPPQWEYKVVVGKCWDEKKINPLGADGWELATYAIWDHADVCVFKRQK